jgi:large subunit ribosomal protein L15
MVVRREKRKRKYLGTRRWGVGNIKNARGHGSKGGTGKSGRGLGTGSKHKWTHTTAYTPELIRKVGFSPWRRKELKEITIREIDKRLAEAKGTAIELEGYKVLSNGSISVKATVKASAFSKGAEQKIRGAGGEAVRLKDIKE